MTYEGLETRYDAVVAENLRLRDKLLEWAKECASCDGTGMVTVVDLFADGHRRVEPCGDCHDIREVLHQ